MTATLCRMCNTALRKKIVTSTSPFLQQKATRFWEHDKKGGYDTTDRHRVTHHIKEGLKEIKPEIMKWKDEWVRNLRCDKVDAFLVMLHNDYEIVWRFNTKEKVDSWIVSTDQDHAEGNSTAEFVQSAHNTGYFRGNIDTTVPKDGIVKEAGYTNIRSQSNTISFKRIRPFDWTHYTHLLVKVRGDGRPYQVVLGMDRYFDVNWHDQYSYPIYTRGGPYWQISKIPFNKFFLSGKGRIQDKQEAVELNKVVYAGITLADGYSGPFQLEIDWIGVVYDEAHNNTFVYEMYEQGYLLSD